MDAQLQEIKTLIDNGRADKAIDELRNLISLDTSADSEPYYLLGNTYRKKGDWQQALNNYLEAMERNPESLAAEAHTMLMSILNFRNTQLYNP